MTFKTEFAANPATYIDIPDGPLLTLPNGDWAWGAIVVFNAALPGSGEYIISNGGAGGAGWTSLAMNPSSGQLFTYIDTSGQVCTLSAGYAPGETWFVGLIRRNNQIFTKACRMLAAMPTDGSAVLTSSAYAMTKELDSARPTRIGARSNGSTTIDRRCDQSLARVFCIHDSITDFEIAKLAHGMTLSDVGKTPVWYVKGDTGVDTLDSGPNAFTVTRSNTFATGPEPGFTYVPAASKPAFTAPPSINGTPTIGVAASYTAGSRAGTAPITDTFQWLVDGVAVGATYTPPAGSVDKTLQIEQTSTNSEGSEVSTSAGKTIVAAATTNTITVTPPANESIFAHTNGARNVAMAVAYEGEVPATIEYQLYASDRVTVRKAWAAVAFSGGNISPSIATSLRKQCIAVRSKNSAGTVLATSAVHPNRFAVGHLVYMGGSSGAQAWGNLMSGAAYDGVDGEIVGQFRSGVWGQGTVKSYATRMAMTLSAALGMAVGMVHNGVSGSSLKGTTGWSTWTSSVFTNARAAIGEVGGKVSSFSLTVGSNDAGNPGGVVSQADHLFYIRQFIKNLRDTVVDPTLPGLWVGMNRRTGTTATAEVYEAQCNWLRAAENTVGDDENVFHVQTLDFEMHGDNVHLTDAGILAQTTRMAYVLVEALAGRYRRGPKVTALTYSGSDLFIDVQHRNGTDLAPASGGTGISLSDASGTPALVSTARVNATRYRATYDRALVEPINAKYLSGGAPDPAAPIVDNGAVPLPMHAETVMVASQAQASVPDTTAPVMVGSITVSNITTSGATLSCSAATDAVGVAGYEYSINGGTSYTLIANGARSVVITGRPEGTEHQVRMRALDAAGNRATPLSATFTTAVTPPVVTPPAQGAVLASTVAESRRVAFPGGTRVVRFGTQPSSVTPNAPYLQAGKWWAVKHPLDERYWVADITIDLAERKTTATSVAVIVAGVTVLEQPVIQGMLIPVKLGGFNAATGAANFCTFRVTCANGERFDRTIWFKQQVGSWSLNKDADDESYFVADIGNDLVDSNTTASAVLAQPVGVSVLVPAVVQGPLILVKLGGMDTLPAGVNYCDLRIDCANSERFYRTIQFNRVDN